MKRRLSALVAAAILATGLGQAAVAEMEISLYTGVQESPHSRIKGDYPGGGTINSLIGWEGRSFENPPYYGLRATWWQSDTFGWGLEFTHAKVYAPDNEKAAAGFTRLELTDGMNLLTVNAMKRWPDHWGRFTPYVGGGLGVAIPHVDIDAVGPGNKTFGYQVTGPAARAFAGAKYDLNDRWALFGEYQFTWSDHTADLKGGGELNTTIYTNAINFGVSYGF